MRRGEEPGRERLSKWEKTKGDFISLLGEAERSRRDLVRSLKLLYDNIKLCNSDAISKDAPRYVEQTAILVRFFQRAWFSLIERFPEITDPQDSAIAQANEELARRLRENSEYDIDEEDATPDDEREAFFGKEEELLDFLKSDLLLTLQDIMSPGRQNEVITDNKLTRLQNLVLSINTGFQTARILYETANNYLKRFFTVH